MVCPQCVSAKKTSPEHLKDVGQYCDEQIKRWNKLVNDAKYLTPEHHQKEREYGIVWRSHFKKEMI